MKQALEASSINTSVKKCQENLRQENIDALQAACGEEAILTFFKEFSYDAEIEVGHFTFFQANCLKKNLAWKDDFKRATLVDLLLIGSGLNGDIVAVDLLDFQASLLFHDYFWEKLAENPRKFLVTMGCSLGQFYLNSVQLPNYPIDAYGAATFVNSSFTGYADYE